MNIDFEARADEHHNDVVYSAYTNRCWNVRFGKKPCHYISKPRLTLRKRKAILCKPWKSNYNVAKTCRQRISYFIRGFRMNRFISHVIITSTEVFARFFIVTFLEVYMYRVFRKVFSIKEILWFHRGFRKVRRCFIFFHMIFQRI